jgi:hypothetical protein
VDSFAQLKLQYVTTGVPLRVLADRLNIPLQDLLSIAKSERWEEERSNFVERVYRDTLEQSKDALVRIYIDTLTGAAKLARFATSHLDEFEIERYHPDTGIPEKKKVMVPTAKVTDIAIALRESRETLKFAMGSPEDFLNVTKEIGDTESEIKSIDNLRKKLSRARKENDGTFLLSAPTEEGGDDELGTGDATEGREGDS